MSRADFDDFLKRQDSMSAQIKPIDPAVQLEEWRAHLSKLYQRVQQLLRQYAERGVVQISFRKVELNEEFSGPYDIDVMDLRIAGALIVFQPIGTMLIGAKGRVDVKGPKGVMRLVLIRADVTQPSQLIRVRVMIAGEPQQDEQVPESSADWVWKISPPPPVTRYIELNEDSFFDLLLNVAGQ